MRIIGTAVGVILIVGVLFEAFETILQPRRVTHRFRFARLYYRSTWQVWRSIALWIRSGKMREGFLSVFGPLSLLGLFVTWIIGLIVGFGLVEWSLGLRITSPDPSPDFGTYLYLSGSTFFTLGYGDVTPATRLGRLLTVMEAGLGFAFLAVLIAYLPVLFQAFSNREVTISLTDARAGSPPSAGEFLLRLGRAGRFDAADRFLEEWERWAAELLESHLSFPVLSYYRSQHSNQSWVAVLAMILDACALLMVAVKRSDTYQAQLTFAMARHAAVDLALVLKVRPQPPDHGRAPSSQHQRLRELLVEAGHDLHDEAEAAAKLADLCAMYEPFVAGLARRFLFVLPPILPDQPTADNWQRSAWMPRTPGIGKLPAVHDDEHFR